MGPFKLKPFYKDYIWGGDKLKKQYNKKTELEIVAESWELSAHKDGSSVICAVSGKADDGFLGMDFLEFTEKYPQYTGTRARGKGFPILIKLIDAKDDLSIQVHPGDEFAYKYEDSPGKTEMWHILEAEEGSFLYIGFNRDLDYAEFDGLIKSGGIVSALNKVPVKRGDTFFIGAGTLHAINSGIVLAEVQQSSNLTYRVYDYGRTGADGKSRELHIDKALKVTNMSIYSETASEADVFRGICHTEKTLANCPYFTVKSILLDGEYRYIGSEETFAAVLVTDGELKIISDAGSIEAAKGDCIFIPAKKTEPVFRGSAEFLLTTY